MSQDKLEDKEIEAPGLSPNLTAAQILRGPYISPINVIRTYESGEFEIFTLEWLVACHKNKYSSIRRCTGAGDKGRDVIGKHSNGSWENFQCKHYSSSFRSSEAALEIAKHIYYAFMGHYQPAIKYYFVVSSGLSAHLNGMLENQTALKDYVKESWKKTHLKNIIKGTQIKLENALESYFDKFDFSIFTQYPIQTIIDEHLATPYHPARFGGGLRNARKIIPLPPENILDEEKNYVSKLLEIYSEKANKPIKSQEDLKKIKDLLNHFERQRAAFFSAESLREFSRDSFLNDEYYNALLRDFYDILIEIVDSNHPDAWTRLLETLKASTAVSISRHPIFQVVKTDDRKGICHQLANSRDEIKWKK